ncbi:hypothetical protein BJ508DRAFT_310047 [Ascobolus immersus RN42]|uniref:Uncharacterized protein n=1 Tax=Ascobolus immersus RN42 TaxID=1160509 RepID=A0A3N4I054_ASCIM|nr:hypothetical protein BJ508DRAFT_310047 [Ascobolus immersus RN42]
MVTGELRFTLTTYEQATLKKKKLTVRTYYCTNNGRRLRHEISERPTDADKGRVVTGDLIVWTGPRQHPEKQYVQIREMSGNIDTENGRTELDNLREQQKYDGFRSPYTKGGYKTTSTVPVHKITYGEIHEREFSACITVLPYMSKKNFNTLKGTITRYTQVAFESVYVSPHTKEPPREQSTKSSISIYPQPGHLRPQNKST